MDREGARDARRDFAVSECGYKVERLSRRAGCSSQPEFRRLRACVTLSVPRCDGDHPGQGSLNASRTDKRMPRFVKLATLEELPEGCTKEVEVEGRIVALFHVGGVISAIDGICPHQGGPLAEGTIEGTTITCPWHGWRFDLRDGRSPLGPKITQTVYEVKIE